MTEMAVPLDIVSLHKHTLTWVDNSHAFFASPPSPDDITLVVSTLTGKKLKVLANPGDMVWVLKIKIRDMEGIPLDQQRLVAKGMQLEDGRTLDDYKIEERRHSPSCPETEGGRMFAHHLGSQNIGREV